MGASDGKGGNDEVAASVHGVVDDFRKSCSLVIKLVRPVAVSRFDDEKIRAVKGDGIA